MFKYIIKLNFLLSIFAITSCTKTNSQPPSDTSKPGNQNEETLTPSIPWDNTPTTFNVVLTFSGTPTEIRFADLKYNKFGVFSMDWDDGARSSLEAMTLFNRLEIPDGTGKMIPWRAGVAIIGKSAYNNIELGNEIYSGALQYNDMVELISNGWDMMNHGLYSGFGGNNESASAFDDVRDLDELLLSRIGYKVAATVVPGMEDGFVEASAELGHLAATSQRNDVGGKFAAVPDAEWKPLTDISTWDTGFKFLTRSFTDTWNASELTEKATELVATSNKTTHKLLRIGTHDSSPTEFNDFITQLNEKMNGNFLVCSLRELMEYEKIKTESKLTIHDGSITVQVPAGLRWEDFTLIVDGAEITSATCTEADEVTFSGNLVNIYKDRLSR